MAWKSLVSGSSLRFLDLGRYRKFCGFQDIDGEKCQLTHDDAEIIKILSDLLGLEEEDLKQVVLLRQINVRGNITEIPLKLQEVRFLNTYMVKVAL